MPILAYQSANQLKLTLAPPVVTTLVKLYVPNFTPLGLIVIRYRQLQLLPTIYNLTNFTSASVSVLYHAISSTTLIS